MSNTETAEVPKAETLDAAAPPPEETFKEKAAAFLQELLEAMRDQLDALKPKEQTLEGGSIVTTLEDLLEVRVFLGRAFVGACSLLDCPGMAYSLKDVSEPEGPSTYQEWLSDNFKQLAGGSAAAQAFYAAAAQTATAIAKRLKEESIAEGR